MAPRIHAQEAGDLEGFARSARDLLINIPRGDRGARREKVGVTLRGSKIPTSAAFALSARDFLISFARGARGDRREEGGAALRGSKIPTSAGSAHSERDLLINIPRGDCGDRREKSLFNAVPKSHRG